MRARRSLFLTSCYCMVLFAGNIAVAQNQPYPSADDGLPYGGPAISPGSILIGPQAQNQAWRGLAGIPTTPPTSPCSTGGVTDPCVLTGQNSRYRTSANVDEPTLSGFNSTTASTFGLAAFYQFDTTDHPGAYPYTPEFAQPLYITNVPRVGVSGTVNMLIAGTLNNSIYAFDTSNGSQVWKSVQNACAGNGPFINNQGNVPGAEGLPYYGTVSTPVIDLLPSPPILFAVYACATSLTTLDWYLVAIDVKSPTAFTPVSLKLSNINFRSSNQLARPALLLTHPTSTQTDVYVSFGGGIIETEAANGSNYAYSGVVFGFNVAYSSLSPYVAFTALTSSPFYDSGSSSHPSVFPSVYTNYDSSGWPLGPACVTNPSGDCENGENWAVNGGGIWMSGKGPASDAGAHVYLTSGNGPFGCAPTGAGTCLTPSDVYYFGQSAILFPAATSTAMGAPVDFFTPYVNYYKNIKSGVDPTPAAYQFEELNKFDQDFGTAGILLMPHSGTATVFSAAADKSTYMYVLGNAGTSGLGEFQAGDTGLMQAPFQSARYPSAANSTPCPVQTGTSPAVSGGPDCDKVHELAWWNDFLFIWPAKETALEFPGTVGVGGTSYTLGSAWDPCVAVPANCTGTTPNFPIGRYPGGAMSIAANKASGTGAAATLWSIVPQPNSGRVIVGSLYTYTVDPSTGHLSHIWDSVTGHNCSAPPEMGWFHSNFTEATLANGVAYVPTFCVIAGGTSPTDCSNSGAGSPSGVLVFAQCP